MSRYYWLLIIALFLAGCATKEEVVAPTQTTKKMFEEEDNLIFQALLYQQKGDYANAKKVYQTLYAQSQKKVYLSELAGLSFMVNDKDAMPFIQEGITKYPKDQTFRRLLVGQYVKEKRYQEAEKEILSLLSEEKSVQHLSIAGNVYLQMQSYDIALKYFESAYKLESSEELLNSIVEVLYRFLGRKADALSYLETYVSTEGCGQAVCFKLIDIYGKDRNVKGLISTYKKLYKENPNEEIARKIVELMLYTKDNNGAVSFLEKTGRHSDMLLNVYASLKRYKEAYALAAKLYSESKNLDYLGKMAIYEYELNKNNLSLEILQSVSKKFEEVQASHQDPLYLNYYGYLLIDHDMDIAKGIALVQRALIVEPNSPYYLDSLAWGLYKQGKCAEASEIMKKFGENLYEAELILHRDAINKCLKEKQ